ncbi:MAG: hypothetical protein IPF54_20335 [Draconibacterium sp.]|nr:hypothetical protein [Draconibacterium sp.]
MLAAMAAVCFGCEKYSQVIEKLQLPSNVIKNIVVDNHGIKWITTDKGVVSYDGVKLTDYLDESLLNSGAANRLFSEESQAANKIWLCSNNGLSVFEHSDEVIIDFVTYKTTQSGILSDSVLAIDIDLKNTRYIDLQQACRFSPITNGLIILDRLAKKYFRNIKLVRWQLQKMTGFMSQH